MTKEEYVEREFKEWSERYVIPFEEDFNVRILLELRYQYQQTPDDHIRKKQDLLHAMERIQKNLNLKQKTRLSNGEKYKILVVGNKGQIHDTFQVFKNIISEDKIVNVLKNPLYAKIETDNSIIEFIIKGDNVRGRKTDYYLNLTNDVEFEDKILRTLLK